MLLKGVVLPNLVSRISVGCFLGLGVAVAVDFADSEKGDRLTDKSRSGKKKEAAGFALLGREV